MGEEGNEEDNCQVRFEDRAWLLANPPLRIDTVLEYFSRSQFYDKNCNNENLRMQCLDSSLLKKMQGIEYTVLPEQCEPPRLFVVRK